MLGIGAAFRIERRLDLAGFRAEAAHHVGDHMVAADAQFCARDLRRQMPVAEVPGNTHEMFLVARADLQQGFRRGQHFDEPPVLQRQRVAGAQHDGFGQVEHEFQTADAFHGDAPAVAVVEIQHDRIGCIVAPGAGRLHFRRAYAHCIHLRLLRKAARRRG